MIIEKNAVVTFHYTVAESGQEPMESSKDSQALSVLIGHSAIIPGLEAALTGKQAGDHVEVTVTPDQAYGERRDGMTQRIPKKLFKNAKLVPGMQVVLPTEMGPRAMTVLKVGLVGGRCRSESPDVRKKPGLHGGHHRCPRRHGRRNQPWPRPWRGRRPALSFRPMD